MGILDPGHAQHFLDVASGAPGQHGYGLGLLVVFQEIMAQFHQGLSGNGIMSRDVAFNRGIPVNLHHIRHIFAARHESTALIHIRPAVIPAMQANRLDALFHLPLQSGKVGLQYLQITLAAHVAERDRPLIQYRLEFLRRGEIRGHERQPEGFAVHRHQIAGHLRFIIRHQHFQWAHHEIRERVHILTAFPDIPPVGLIDAQVAARRIDILGALDRLLQCFLAVGRPVCMMYLVPFLPE